MLFFLLVLINFFKHNRIVSYSFSCSTHKIIIVFILVNHATSPPAANKYNQVHRVIPFE